MKNFKNSTDRELILAYQTGNLKALNTLVKKWHVQFCKFANWIVKDTDTAKDIAQESWKIIFSKINTLQEPEKFRSWAISIINRKSIDFLRAQQRRNIKLKNYYIEQADNIVSYEVENRNYREKLIKAISELPKNQNEVVKLFYQQNYSLKEISELLQISVGTAKSRLFHAREKLKTILKNKSHE